MKRKPPKSLRPFFPTSLDAKTQTIQKGGCHPAAFFIAGGNMARPKIYGIKNCDSMKKAFLWLDKHGIAYDFHDYKKSGGDAAVLEAAIKAHGWENVINRKGTTWRALPEKARESMTEKTALAAALDNPSLVKRPLIVSGKDILLGYDEAAFKATLKA
jgi:arsenate reductase